MNKTVDNDTTDVLATLERLMKEATPGPWGSIVFQSEDVEMLASVGPSKGAVCRMTTTQKWQTADAPANAALIALLRNAAPALLEVATHSREVGASGVELDLPQLSYVTVQIERETWEALRAALRALDKVSL